MALPNMPSIYTTRKNIYEAAIVRRRTHENDFRDVWTDNARYFNSADIHSSKDSNWTSRNTFQNSMDAYRKNYEKDTKAISLARRRSKLNSLLQSEKNQYEAELKGYSIDNYDRINDMKGRVDSLKSAREEERKLIAQEKLYEHFRQNSPDIRKLESDQFKDHVIGRWSDQVEEKRAVLEEERIEKEQYEAELERQRVAALEKQRKIEKEKLDNELRMRDILKKQMAELKDRERESGMIKQQQDTLLREQWELEQLEEKRRLVEEDRKKHELGRVLLRQHAAHMRRKVKQVMEELEQDRQLLESLIDKQEQDVAIQTARKEKARADASWMKQVIEDQLRLEREREAELDMLYQDEAAKIWSQREDEWKREREARQRLMQDVLVGRQEQIESKMEELQKQHEESLQRREELLQDLERANQLTRREQESAEHAKSVAKEEYGVQVTARREQAEKKVMDELAQLEEEKRAEQDYDEMLRQEAERLRIKGYQPQIRSRRGKQAWQ